MSWLQDALVLFTARLSRNVRAENLIVQMASGCRAKYLEDPVSVNVVSIEHVVLVRVYRDMRVDCITVLPLSRCTSRFKR